MISYFQTDMNVKCESVVKAALVQLDSDIGYLGLLV